MKKKSLFWLVIVLLAAFLLSSCATPAATTTAPTDVPAPAEPTEAPAEPEPTEAPAPEEPETPAGETGGVLILATTTSTQDSGLLDVILPVFEQEYGVEVDVIAVGTGQALTLGQDGNADVLLVHARAREDEFMAAGHGVRREDVMYNDFVILGAADDPAGIRGMADAAAALKQIADAGETFISRGDESGTHTKELSVWKAAGIEEPSGDWYISAGQGMGEVLTMAGEQLAYTLSDRATYLARTQTGLELEVLVEGDPVLFNPYGVIAVNPDKGPHIKVDLANQFIDWIISLPTQEMIAQFGVDEFGQSLFIPDSQAWRDAQGGAESEPAGDAAFSITGLVQNEMAWSEAEMTSMEAIEVDFTNKDGETQTFTGVPLAELLALAGINPEAATLVFVADDGFTSEAAYSEVQACSDCIVAFADGGGFRSVMPGFPGSLQVKGLIEIQVK